VVTPVCDCWGRNEKDEKQIPSGNDNERAGGSCGGGDDKERCED
jgi:hypothetical protein